MPAGLSACSQLWLRLPVYGGQEAGVGEPSLRTHGYGEQKDKSNWLPCEGRGELSDGSRDRCGLQARLDPGAHSMTPSSPRAPLTVPFSVLTQFPGGLSSRGRDSAHDASSATPVRRAFPSPGPGPDAQID